MNGMSWAMLNWLSQRFLSEYNTFSFASRHLFKRENKNEGVRYDALVE
jgi:hypothetical protein